MHLRIAQGGVLVEAPNSPHRSHTPWLASACCQSCPPYSFHYGFLNSALLFAWVQLISPGAEPCTAVCKSVMTDSTMLRPATSLGVPTTAAAASSVAASTNQKGISSCGEAEPIFMTRLLLCWHIGCSCQWACCCTFGREQLLQRTLAVIGPNMRRPTQACIAAWACSLMPNAA